jgi:hypothetical protein
VVGVAILSHWILDLVVHRPDLPLIPGAELRAGFGLWNRPSLAIGLEIILFMIGVYYYQKKTVAKNKFGHYGLIFLLTLLFVIYLANLFGPPPPDVKSIAWAGHLQWLFVILAFYVDKNRVVR